MGYADLRRTLRSSWVPIAPPAVGTRSISRRCAVVTGDSGGGRSDPAVAQTCNIFVTLSSGVLRCGPTRIALASSTRLRRR